jgi:hypothetical protein
MRLCQTPGEVQEGAVRGDMKTNGGVDALSNSDKKAANRLFDILAGYGIFVVDKGVSGFSA